MTLNEKGDEYDDDEDDNDENEDNHHNFNEEAYCSPSNTTRVTVAGGELDGRHS